MPSVTILPWEQSFIPNEKSRIIMKKHVLTQDEIADKIIEHFSLFECADQRYYYLVLDGNINSAVASIMKTIRDAVENGAVIEWERK